MRGFTVLAVAALTALAVTAGAQTEPANPTAPEQERTQATTRAQAGPNYVDNDGDGICDNYQVRQGTRGRRGRGYGPGDGTGNQGVGPRDGSGYGPGTGAGTGRCDGTGPKGRGGRRGRN
jgi:hypothetical protein